MCAQATPSDETQGTALSKDGTRIGYVRLGRGPALVVAHGSLSEHSEWLPVARLLAPRFTCFLLDRRGRGLSGDGEEGYCVEREGEDIAAVLEAAGPDASLLGHSFGAICALRAALRGRPRRLVLYEPPLPVTGPVGGDYLPLYRDAVAQGRLDDALGIGLTRFARVPADVVRSTRSAPIWGYMQPLAPTWTREVAAIDGLGPDVREYTAIRCPVLLLVGTTTPEHHVAASNALTQVLEDVRLAPLKWQGHMAMRTAPELVAGLVGSFLSEPGQ